MNGVFLSIALLVSGHTAQVEVFETQLPAYTSTLVGIEEDRVLLRQANNDRSVSLNQMLRVKFKGSPEPNPVNLTKLGNIEVQLIDGSQTTCSEFSYDGKAVVLRNSAERKFELPVAMISNCILQQLNEAQRAQWTAIASSRISTDQLIVIRSAEAIDTVEGVISGIDSNGVKFEFDGQSIVAPFAKLAGLRFFTKAEPVSSGRLLAVVRDQLGSNWMVSKIVSNQESPEGEAIIELVCGSQLRLPLESLSEIDFSFGSMRFLAELVPLNRSSPARFKLNLELPEASELFSAQFLAAESGNGADSGPGLQFVGIGSITYRVPDGFRRLLGSVELSPDGPHYVPCRAVVLLEEKVLWEKELTETRRADKLDLVVESGKRVRIIVQTQATSPVGDLVLFKQLRFVK